MRLRRGVFAGVVVFGLILGIGAVAQAVELRVTTSADLVACASGLALAAGPDAGKIAAPGDTCVLNPGTYTLAVTVTLANLTIRSRDGKFATTITGGITVAAGVNGVKIGGSSADQGVTITGAPGVGLTVFSIEDFTLQNSDVLGNGGVGILVGTGGSVRDFQFLSIIVRGNGGAGLSFASGSSVSNVTINDAVFESNAGSGISFTNPGEVSRLGIRNVTIRTAGGGGSGVFFGGAVTDVRSSDIVNSTIEGNAAFGVNFANGGRVEEFAFSSVRCNSNPFGNVAFANGGDVADVLVENSTFNRSGTAFGMGFINGGGVEGLDVSGSEFDQNATVGLGFGALPDDFADSSFTDNRFRNNGTHGLFAGLTTSSIQDLDFSDNEFSQNTMTGAFFGTTMGDVAGFRFDGDRFTKNGTWGLDVNTGVGPTIGAGDIGEFEFSNIIVSENATAPLTAGVRLGSMSDGDVVNIKVTDSQINNNGGFGMQLISAGGGGATPGEVSNVDVQRSSFDFNGTRAAAGQGSGLMLFGRKVGSIEMMESSANDNNDHGADFGAIDSVTDVMTNGGSFSNNDRNVDSIGDGIRVNAGAGGTVTNVTLENLSANNNDSGIIIDVQGRNGSSLTIQNNPQVNQNRDVGIGVMSSEDLNGVLIAGNTVQGNAFNIVVRATVDGSNIVVRGNKLVGASGTGVLSEASGVSVNSNDIRRHSTGIQVKKADNVHINNNNIVQNSTGVDASGLSGKRVDATNNWWGEPSGPSGAGPGIGDRVSNNVDFQPFLTAPAVATGANFLLTNVAVPAQVGVGQTATINATVTNAGGDEGTQEIKIRVLGAGGVVAQQESRTTTLNPSGSTEISFQVTLAEGSYTVEISTDNDSVTRTLTVGSGGSTPPPSGGSIEAALDVNNNNRIDDTEILVAIALWINGSTVAGTNETISDAKIRELIQMWISGTPIQ